MNAEQFKADLESGAFAWPGGYPRRFIMGDGESLCFKCAEKESSRVLEAIAEGDSEWAPAACEVYWEGAPEQCAHCNAEIESAYGAPEDDSSALDGPEVVR